jgi:hypothetical protein
MAQLSKQALQVENNTSFPNNTTNYITPTLLRTFNTDMIESNVNQTEYTSNSGSWNVSIGALNQFTASQQPSFNALNAFTASQLTINTGYNQFTQSANASITALNSYTASVTSSISVYDESILVSSNISALNFTGNGITASYVSGKAVVTVDFTSLNSFTSSQNIVNTQLNSFTSSQNVQNATLAVVTSSLNQATASIYQTTASLNAFTQSVTGSINALNAFTQSFSTASFVSTSSFNSYTASTNIRLNNIESTTSSLNTTTASLNQFTSSTNTSITNLNIHSASVNTTTASLNTSVSNLNLATASLNTSVTNLNLATQSLQAQLATIGTQSGSWGAGQVTSASFNAFTASTNQFTASVNQTTASLNQTTASLNTFTASVNQTTASLNTFTASAQISINNLNAATSSYITSAQTASMSVASASVATAVSASISTQNLQHFVTFTDSSTGKQAIYVDGGLKYNPNQDLLLIPNITSSGYISASAIVINGVPVATSAITASSLVTASFDNGTRNLTFTKGDTTQFSLNIPDVSGSTGNFATTGSNSFNGNQTISGSLTISSSATTDVLVKGQLFITGGNYNSAGAVKLTLQGYNASGADIEKIILDGYSMTFNRSGSAIGGDFIASISPNGGYNVYDNINGPGGLLGLYSVEISGDANGNGIGLTSNNSQIGGANNNPALYTYDSTGSFVTLIEGQTTNNWTDGAITIMTPTNITGSLTLTGSAHGNVVSASITSNTASIDFSKANYFELTASVSPLNINVINITKGTTSTLAISGSTASTITFSPNVQQPSGSAYTASVSGQTDILSLVAFNSSKVNVVSTLKMI